MEKHVRAVNRISYTFLPSDKKNCTKIIISGETIIDGINTIV